MLTAMPSEIGITLTLDQQAYFHITYPRTTLSLQSSTTFTENNTVEFFNQKHAKEVRLNLYKIYINHEGLLRPYQFNMDIIRELRIHAFTYQSKVIREKWKWNNPNGLLKSTIG